MVGVVRIKHDVWRLGATMMLVVVRNNHDGMVGQIICG